MTYLSPEIEALAINTNAESLLRPNVSCGIFQDWEYHKERANPYQQ